MKVESESESWRKTKVEGERWKHDPKTGKVGRVIYSVIYLTVSFPVECTKKMKGAIMSIIRRIRFVGD